MRTKLSAVVLAIAALAALPSTDWAGASPEPRESTTDQQACSRDASGLPKQGLYDQGYWLAAADGGVFAFGQAAFQGSAVGMKLNAPIVGIEEDGDYGYWLVGRDGGVFTFGTAKFHGSAADRSPAPSVAGMVATLFGYRVAARDGRVFSWNAEDLTGLRPYHLNGDVIGIASPLGDRYWLLEESGRVVNFGGAAPYGSVETVRLNAPVVGIAAHISGRGYWVTTADGGVFSFGEAPFLGSLGNVELNAPIVGIEPTISGNGYWLVAADGGVFSFGDAPFLGSAGGIKLNAPIVGMAACHGPGGPPFVSPN